MNNKQNISASWLGWVKKIRLAAKTQAVQKISAPLGVIRRMIRPPITELVKLSGIEKFSQTGLTINCGLKSQNYHLWLDLLFGEAAVENSKPSRYRLKDIFAKKSVVGKDGALTVISLKYSDYEAYNDGRWFFIPEWVSGAISLPLSQKCLSQERVKSDIRKIRNNGFVYDVSRDPQAFDEFYKTMHLPYISKRHGETAMFDTFAENRKLSEQYDLLLVKKIDNPDVYIAGIMIVYEAQGPRLWSLGIREGDDYIQQGVNGALYHFSFRHLLEQDFDHVRTGGARAFLNDGVFRFKRKFSQTIIGSNWKGFALGIHSFTPAVKAFLLNNPFIFKRRDVLTGALFVESAAALTEREIRRLHKDYAQQGISSLKIFCFDLAGVELSAILPEDLREGLSIAPADELLI